MKTCLNCKIEKDVSEFHRDRKRSDGFEVRCKDCISIRNRASYERHQSAYIEKSRQYYTDNKDHCNQRSRRYYRKSGKEKWFVIFQYLAQNPCVDCGERDVLRLQFDHINGKNCNVTRLISGSLEEIFAEIKLCEVRCANCHQVRHLKEVKSLRYQSWLEFMEASET